MVPTFSLFSVFSPFPRSLRLDRERKKKREMKDGDGGCHVYMRLKYCYSTPGN